jgi:hypothetical protein
MAGVTCRACLRSQDEGQADWEGLLQDLNSGLGNLSAVGTGSGMGEGKCKGRGYPKSLSEMPYSSPTDPERPHWP